MKNVDDILKHMWYNMSKDRFLSVARNWVVGLKVVNDGVKLAAVMLTDCVVELRKIFLILTR